ncbi:unnamed protein product [Camellia sinensis]
MIQNEGCFSLYKGLVPLNYKHGTFRCYFYDVCDILKSAYLRSPEGRKRIQHLKEQVEELNALEQLGLGALAHTLAPSSCDRSKGVCCNCNCYKNYCRERGAILLDNLDIANMDVIMNLNASGEAIAILAEFKFSINTYLKELVTSPVRSLADVIAFNQKFSNLEMLDKYGHEIFVLVEATNGIGKAEEGFLNLERLSKHGFEKIMIENDLDGLVALADWEVAHVLVIGWISKNHCSVWISHKWYAIWDIFCRNQGFGAEID